MDTETFTSAGRLLSETRLLAKAFAAGGSVVSCLPRVYGEGHVRWARGIAAYHRLIAQVQADLDVISENRRDKYWETLAKLQDAVQFGRYAVDAKKLSDAHLTPTLFERLEFIDEMLLSQGRSARLDEHRARAVASELEEMLQDLEQSERSEIDQFVFEKLEELRFVLERYHLFGAEGVQDTIGELIGGYALRVVPYGGSIPEPVKLQSKRLFQIVKGAMDAFVYTHSGAQAVEWGTSSIAGLLPG